MSVPIQLPDESKTLVITDSIGRFKGQATYWKRNGRWEMIGVTRPVNFLHEVDFENVENCLTCKGLKFKWAKSPPFSTHSFRKDVAMAKQKFDPLV